MEKAVVGPSEHELPPKQASLMHKLSGLVGWVTLVVGTFIGAQYFVSIVLFVLKLAGVTWQYDAVVSSLIIRLAVYSVMVVMIGAAVWYRYHKLIFGWIGLSRLAEWSDIGLSLAGAVIYTLTSVIALNLAANIPGFNPSQPQDLGFTHLYGNDLVIAFAVLVVLTPLFEEVIFRGFLYGRLRRLQLPWWFSAVVVSVLFGVAHMQWNVGIDVFFLSMVACILREMTGSIWAGILIHIMKNFLAFLVIAGFVQ